MKHRRQWLFTLADLLLNRDDQGHPLLYIEDILVWRAVRADFHFLGISMQVQHMDRVKRVEQVPAHTTEGWVVQIAVIGDVG
jgi:hypothetical protein